MRVLPNSSLSWSKACWQSCPYSKNFNVTETMKFEKFVELNHPRYYTSTASEAMRESLKA